MGMKVSSSRHVFQTHQVAILDNLNIVIRFGVVFFNQPFIIVVFVSVCGNLDRKYNN